ncbi:MAG: YciI family protein [Betaproteobacteria bacterium]|jgi:hypothetical protein|nr:YciI family protein [Betaproteobacteria bacterium]
MKYLCLVYLDESAPQHVADSDCLAYDAAIRASGHCIASEALQPVRTATTVRVRNGQVSVTDGPFAETKEQLAGFYLIDAKDLDEAIALAARIPPAQEGSVEVRPIRPIREIASQSGASVAHG